MPSSLCPLLAWTAGAHRRDHLASPPRRAARRGRHPPMAFRRCRASALASTSWFGYSPPLLPPQRSCGLTRCLKVRTSEGKRTRSRRGEGRRTRRGRGRAKSKEAKGTVCKGGALWLTAAASRHPCPALIRSVARLSRIDSGQAASCQASLRARQAPTSGQGKDTHQRRCILGRE